MPKTPYDYGASKDPLADNTDALYRLFAAGGDIQIPEGIFRFGGKMLPVPDGLRVTHWAGNLSYFNGWVSGYGIGGADWSKPSKGVVMDATDGGALVYEGNENTAPRKGFGIIFDGAQLIRLRVKGGASKADGKPPLDQFQYEFRDGTNNVLTGCTGDLVSGKQGCDLFHFSKNSSGNRLNNCGGRSGDDIFGLTAENPKFGPVEISDNHVNGGEFTTYGHSAVKHLSAVNNGSKIHGTVINGATFHVVPIGANPGQPVIVQSKPNDTVDFPMMTNCKLFVV